MVIFTKLVYNRQRITLDASGDLLASLSLQQPSLAFELLDSHDVVVVLALVPSSTLSVARVSSEWCVLGL